MSEEEKYPQIQLHPNGDYHIFIEPYVSWKNVLLKFNRNYRDNNCI